VKPLRTPRDRSSWLSCSVRVTGEILADPTINARGHGVGIWRPASRPRSAETAETRETWVA
jgi:hypothetical protein